jgi:hypothetical protein
MRELINELTTKIVVQSENLGAVIKALTVIYCVKKRWGTLGCLRHNDSSNRLISPILSEAIHRFFFGIMILYLVINKSLISFSLRFI